MKLLNTIILTLLSLTLCAQANWVSVKHIDADFRQEKRQAMLAEPQILTGHFSYDAPSVVSWLYDKGVEARLPEQMLTFIASAVSGEYMQSNDDFRVTSEGNTITLVPLRRQLRKLFTSVVLYIQQNTNIARKVVLNEVTGDITTITFSNINTN